MSRLAPLLVVSGIGWAYYWVFVGRMGSMPCFGVRVGILLDICGQNGFLTGDLGQGGHIVGYLVVHRCFVWYHHILGTCGSITGYFLTEYW